MCRSMMALMLFFLVANASASTGGVLADPGTFRYLVSINYKTSNYYHFCMGSQAAPEALITAAHCMRNPQIPGKQLYAVRFLSTTDLAASRIRESAVHPVYGTGGPLSADPHDVATLKTQSSFPSGNLSYEPDFDPYSYLKRQPRQEVLVDDFGFNQAVGAFYTSKAAVMSGDKCLEQILDLSRHEWAHLSGDEKFRLDKLRAQLAGDPKSAFCSFVKKSDPFRHEPGDSGAPLVFSVDGKAMLAGVLVSLVPLPSTQQYAMISLYINIANNQGFLASCAAKKPGARSGREAMVMVDAASDPCDYRGVDVSVAPWSLLLQ